MVEQRVEYAVSDGVGTIEMVRPGGNALDLDQADAFRVAAESLVADVAAGRVRVAVVRARGKMFSVGGDLGDFATSPDRGARVKAIADSIHAGLALVHGLEIPVVSVIQGTAAGGGLGVALVGDIVIAAEEAKMVLAYTAAGLTPDCGLSWILPNRLTAPRYLDLVLTNRTITGREAAEWGLVSRAVPAADLEAEVGTVVDGLRSGPSGAFAAAKRLLRDAGGRTVGESMDAEAEGIAAAIAAPEGVEGVDAFIAKRRPVFHPAD